MGVRLKFKVFCGYNSFVFFLCSLLINIFLQDFLYLSMNCILMDLYYFVLIISSGSNIL